MKKYSLKKISAGILASMAFIGASMTFNTVCAAENSLCTSLSLYSVRDSGLKSISLAQAKSGAYGKILAKLPVGAEEKAALILAVYDSDGRLKSIHTDSKAKDTSFKTLSAEAEIEDTQKLSCFVFDGLDTIRPLSVSDTSPVKTSYTDGSSVVLSWDTSDFPAADKYLISRSGTVIGETTCGRFSDLTTRPDSLYSYTVTPVSGGTKLQGQSVNVLSGSVCTAVMGENPVYKNISFVNNDTNDGSDSYTENAFIGGRSCRASVAIPKSSPKRSGMMYFSVNRSIIPQSAKQVTFEVTYFDNGIKPINIEYNSPDSIAKPVKLADRTNTNTWKTARVSVSDAGFCSPAALQSSDFRISGGAETYISKVCADQSQFFAQSAPYADISNAQYPETYGMTIDTSENGYSFTVSRDKLTSMPLVVGINAVPNAQVEVSCMEQTKTLSDSGSGVYTAVFDIAETDPIIYVSITNSNGEKNKSGDLKLIYANSSAPQNIYSSFAEGGISESGMKFSLAAGDAASAAAEIGGRSCRKSEADTVLKKNRYLYFNADNRYVFGTKDSDITLEADYYDDGTGTLTLQYNTDGNAYKSVELAKLTDSKTWKTAKITVTDACFTDSQNYSNDFRIGGPDVFYLSAVRLLVNKTEMPDRSSTQIFLASDSTCEDLPEIYAPREGWGMEIGNYFTSSVQIINKAKGGKSSRTFLNGMDPTAVPVVNDDKRIEDIISRAKAGDYLFIQFGHNDRPITRPVQRTDPDSTEQNETSYRYNLKQFVKIARENDMIPVFITSINERNFEGNTDTLAADGIEPYRNAMREVGAECGVPVLDIAPAHKALVEHWGNEGSKQLYLHFTKTEYPNYPATLPDNTHISKTGANEVAKLVASAIKEGAKTNADLERLAKKLDSSKSLAPTEPN